MTHGDKNIEAHHRQQVPVKNGGILDELEQRTHRGGGNHTKKSVPSGPYREVNRFLVKVKPGAQEKHIPHTPNYKQELANGKHKSIFYGDNKKAQELLDEFAGKGTTVTKNKERVDFGEPIGKYYDRDTGNYVETTRGLTIIAKMELI